MLRIAIALASFAIVACAHGPKINEVVFKAGLGRKITARDRVSSATFCSTCGENASVTIGFGTPPRVSLAIPLCYPHAHSKIGDHDKISVELVDGHIAATEGQLDIEDCTTKHLTAKLWSVFPDGTRIDARIDTELQNPAK
ncbi:MAG: hypothetical protein H6Q90_6589 [Deltaproteobacteria bacterium]|nr:hypothetical protein [Deltaproteobacteria bacterium]